MDKEAKKKLPRQVKKADMGTVEFGGKGSTLAFDDAKHLNKTVVGHEIRTPDKYDCQVREKSPEGWHDQLAEALTVPDCWGCHRVGEKGPKNMAKRKSRRVSKSKAIQNALGELGWHASGKDVMALLGSYGIEVSEGLVHKVKLEGLKDASGLKRQEAKMQQAGHRPSVPRKQKVPPQRSYRR